jgi:hypothetical protein
MLEAALCLAADSCPAPASILLFAKGVAGIHHLHQA